MPAVSERQRRFAGADLARKRAGKKTKTGMSESQLRDFARKRGGKAKRRGGMGASGHLRSARSA